MQEFPLAALVAAQKTISSTIRKDKKALDTLLSKKSPQPFQISRISQQLNALQFISTLITEELNVETTVHYSDFDGKEAVQTIRSLIQAIEKIKPKLGQGTSQYTLAMRRLDALHIGLALMEKRLNWLPHP